MKRKRGRPAIGERRTIAVTMEHEDWWQVDEILQNNDLKFGEYLRNLILEDLEKQGQVNIHQAIKRAKDEQSAAKAI